MVDGAFESWSFIFLNFEKTFVIRTHPEELRVVKCAPNTRISTHFYTHAMGSTDSITYNEKDVPAAFGDWNYDL